MSFVQRLRARQSTGIVTRRLNARAIAADLPEVTRGETLDESVESAAAATIDATKGELAA